MRQFRDTPFFVTEDGRVFSYDRRYKTPTLKERHPRINNPGYFRVTDDVTGRDYAVHVMVMECYGTTCPGVHGRRAGEYNIHHIDEDKANNKLDNLTWELHEEHIKYHHPSKPGTNYRRKTPQERREDNIAWYDRKLAREGRERIRHLTPRDDTQYKRG